MNIQGIGLHGCHYYFVVYQSCINEDENPSCSKHPLPYASIPSAKLAQ